MPIKKIPTVSRRFHPALMSAAAVLLGVAGGVAAWLVKKA